MILSRFFKPKWQHPDPRVRKLAVESLSASDPVLTRIARQDQNPSVRCAALHRINDLQLLHRISTEDAEDKVRKTAEELFRKRLTGQESDGPDLATRLSFMKQLSSAGLDELILTHAIEPEMRLAALERTGDESILSKIAIHDPSAQVRFAALERIHDIGKLEHVVKHSRNRDKRVNRSARERLDALRAQRNQQAQAEHICDRLEALSATDVTPSSAGRFHTLERDWQRLSNADTELEKRYRNAHDRFSEQLAASKVQRESRVRVFAMLDDLVERMHNTQQLSTQVDSEIDDTVQRIEEQWKGLGDTDTYSEQRYAEQLRAVIGQHRRLQRNRERTERLREILARGDALASQAGAVYEQQLTELKHRWGSLERPEAPDLAAELQLQFDATVSRLRARLRRQAEQREQELTALHELLDQLEAALAEGALQRAMELRDQARRHLKENISLSLKETESLERRLHACNPGINELRGWRRWGTGQAREHLCEAADALIGLEEDPLTVAKRVKQLRATWKSLDGIEGAASKTLWHRFNTACERAYEPCQAYFDDRARERQTNFEKKRALCEQLEQFAAENDWSDVDWRAADRTWREAQNQWRKIGPVDRAERKALDRRFSKALRRFDTHLETERQRSLQQRRALIEKVQQLALSEDLRAAISDVKQAQREWHPTVLASRREEQALWKQFRAACDAVFDRRQAEQRAIDAQRKACLNRKLELCETIETLLDAGNEEALAQARAKFQEATREWESIGPIPKARQREIDYRFDQIREDLQRSLHDRARAASREAMERLRAKAQLCARIETLLKARQDAVQDAPSDEHSAADIIIDRLQRDWDALPALKPPLERAIRSRFNTARAALQAGAEACRARLRELEADLETKKALCLHMEIVSGVDSPPELTQARMEYQVSRLSESLKSRATPSAESSVQDEAHQIEQQWYLLGALPSASHDSLEARFNRAVGALHETRDAPSRTDQA